MISYIKICFEEFVCEIKRRAYRVGGEEVEGSGIKEKDK